MSGTLNAIRQVLDTFDPISLQQMDGVKLLDRVDTKFMFRDTHLPSLLEAMKSDYFLLEVSGHRYSHYETLYFDTEDFGLYVQHHNGRLNRYKFRSRRYVESDLNFFEVKFKNNKGRTVKERIKRPSIPMTLEGKPSDLVRAASPVDPDSLRPAIWVNYIRLTFVSKSSQERLTVDIDLNFSEGAKRHAYEGLVIAEVKQGSGIQRS
ncbi:MAG: polyphosphate polymerase domain-containing protein, partial [Bacteroidota bacterium]